MLYTKSGNKKLRFYQHSQWSVESIGLNDEHFWMKKVYTQIKDQLRLEQEFGSLEYSRNNISEIYIWKFKLTIGQWTMTLDIISLVII